MSDRQFCIIDYETFSETPIKKVGGWEYSKHPSTEVLCAAWRVGTRESLPTAKNNLYLPLLAGDQNLNKLRDVLADERIIKVAHNAFFEQCITNHVLKVPTKPQHWTCTATMAAAMALPRKLEAAARVLGLPVQKDSEGHRLMLKLSQPRKPTKHDKSVRHQKPDELKRVARYCLTDVDVETELFLRLPTLAPVERQVWILDQLINSRGVTVDRELVRQVIILMAIEQVRINERVGILSDYSVKTVNQHAKLKEWLECQGVFLPNLQKATIDEALSAGLAEGPAFEMLELRRDGSKTSTAKYEAFDARSRGDGRARDNLIYHGADTGRWCLPEGTQVLTPEGWKPIETAPPTIMIWHPEGVAEFSSVQLWHTYRANNETIYGSTQRNASFMVSSRHELVVKTARKKDWFKTKVTAVYGSRVTIPTCSFNLNQTHRPEIETRVMVMVQADGCYIDTAKEHCVKLGFRKQRKIERCLSLLRQAGINCRVSNDKDATRIRIPFKQAPEWLQSFKDKNFQFSQNHDPNVFIDELRYWDSHQQRGLTSFEYSTCNENNAIFAQTMAHLAGFSARIVKRDRKNGWNINYRVYVRPTTTASVRQWSQAQYTGDMFCPSVSSGCFFIRFNGVISVTGNSGTGIQLQNLVRPTYKQWEIDHAIEIVKHYKFPLWWLRTCYGSPMEMFSSMLRSAVIAGPGKILTVADFASIEARVVFWLADHEAGLKAFREGAKLYEMMAAAIFGIPVSAVKKDGLERFIGKQATLGCSYQLGATKFQQMCLGFGQEISMELAERAVKTYRTVHKPVVNLWSNYQKAAIAAVENPGKLYALNHTEWFIRGDFLHCRLPSGRLLAYHKPSVVYEDTKYGKRPTLRYWATNGTTKQWEEVRSYGGLLTENVTQAVARDLMAAAMLRIEKTGIWEIVLTVHDELIGERDPSGPGSAEMFCKLMSEVPDWAAGCPVAAEGWEGMRYKK